MKTSRPEWLLTEIKLQWPTLAKAGVGITVGNTLQIFTSLFVMVVYNKVIPNEAHNTLTTLAMGVIVLIVFDFLFKILKSKLADEACQKIEAKLGPRLYNKILSWDLQNLPKSVGHSASLNRDLDNTIELFASSTITTIVTLPFIVVYLVVIFLIGGSIVSVPIGLGLCLIAVHVFSFYKSKHVAVEYKNKMIDRSGAFLETLTNLETLKSIGSYEYFESKWDKVSKESRSLSSRIKAVNANSSALNALVIALNQVGVVSLGAWLISEQKMSSGALIACVLLSSKALQPILQISGLLGKIAQAGESIKRLTSVFQSASAEERRRENFSVKQIKFNIRITNLIFQPESLNRPILSTKRLKINYGESVGIIGSVGSGKSTFLKLLAGVLTPTEGQLAFGEFDITAINQTDLRRNIAFVGQNPGVFGGSIRDNLVMGAADISDEEIIELCRVSGLSEVLKYMPNGLSFQLSENGKELSGGQRQILALARAFSTQPNYLFFDEPTSAMDPKSERLFVEKMADYAANKTMVVVTHRKPILALTSRLIVIEQGQIVLDGRKDEVLKKLSA